MANLLQSTQTKSTCAPGFYTNYLSNLAQAGQAAQQQAQFVGAQPLQQQAFTQAAEGFGAFQPNVATGAQYLGQAAGQNITGAAAPYLQAGTTASPLCAARPMICSAANLNLAGVASDYMNPYIQSAIRSISDIAQRNIRQNLSPAATAAAVGSGQYGSQRGAQVLGQITAQAEQDLNKQIADMLSTGYGQSLQAAQAKQSALTQAAQQISQAQQAQNQAQLTAAQTAGSTAAQQAQALQQAGLGMGTLGTQASGMRLACINALSTLGGQQQQIAQNQQMFPLTTLGSLASLLQGYSIPTATRTQLQMSPFSAAAAIGAGGLGVLQCYPKYAESLGKIFGTAGAGGSSIPTGGDAEAQEGGFYGQMPITTGGDAEAQEGGFYGAMNPFQTSDVNFPIGCDAYAFSAKGGLIESKSSPTGCSSTRARGALPYKKG